MPIDVYQPCPGGMNKKIKFCECGQDILGDLSKIVDSQAGGQKAAAIAHINRLLEQKGPRACLLALKGNTLLEMGNLEALNETTTIFLEAFPANPIALAFSAIQLATEAEIDGAISRLQEALEASDGTVQESLYAGLGLVGQLLIQAGLFSAAIGHLSLHAAISDEQDRSSFELLQRIYSSPEIPMLLKQRSPDMDPPEGADWAERLKAAEEPAQKGCWAAACRNLEQLNEDFPNQAAILSRLAMYQAWLNQVDEAAKNLRQLAAVEDLDQDVAVEAEALAQLLGSIDDPETITEVSQSYPITDADRMLELLLSDKRVTRITGDLSQMAPEGSPPPKGAFWLLDRPEPESVDDLQVEDIPLVLGEVYLFGRETDRDARLEFVTQKSDDIEQKQQTLKELMGDLGGEMEKEETIGEVPVETAALSWRWRLPETTPQDRRTSLVDEKRRDVNLNVWPKTPLAVLDGKTPAVAAADWNYRIKVMAAILLLEMSGERARSTFDYNELRAKLSLPTRDDIDPASVDLETIPASRLHLLPPEKLSPEQLLGEFEHALTMAAPRAIHRLGQEIIKKPDLIPADRKPTFFAAMASFANDIPEALAYTHQARAAAEAIGQSPAPWLLRELEMQLVSGNGEAAGELFRVLQTKHIREPGVAQALQQLLVRLGLVSSDGRMNPAAAAQGGPAGPVSGDHPDAAPAGGGLFTSDAPAPPAGGQGEKPSIWVPGMD